MNRSLREEEVSEFNRNVKCCFKIEDNYTKKKRQHTFSPTKKKENSILKRKRINLILKVQREREREKKKVKQSMLLYCVSLKKQSVVSPIELENTKCSVNIVQQQQNKKQK